MGVYKVTYPGTGKVSYGVDYRDPRGRKIRRIVSDRKKVAEAIWVKIQVGLETGAYYDRKQIRTFTIKDLIEKSLEWFKGRRSFETERIHLSAIAAHVGRSFDPLKLPGRLPPLVDDFSPDPFPDYGPQ